MEKWYLNRQNTNMTEPSQSSYFSVLHPPPRPLLVYDGDCGFCRKWAGRWKGITGDKVDYEPYQKAAASYPEIPIENFQKAVQLIEPDGTVTGGAQAVFKTLGNNIFLGWTTAAYVKIPGFAFISEKVYAFVASHRSFFSSVDSCGTAQADARPTYLISRWLFFKSLALVYLVTFISLWAQIDGLIGRDGILPLDLYLRDIQEQLGGSGFFYLPTLFWFNDSSLFLHLVCGAGVALSILLLFDLAPSLCLLGLWGLYLSLVTAGQDFLGFQWDNLVLEAGFLAFLAAPMELRRGSTKTAPFSQVILWLFQWLLFRVMFCSGAVKLVSGDPTWRDLTALHYHYLTQPMPTPLAWFMARMPMGFHQASCLFVFFVELIVPFFIFGPRRFRPWAFGFLVSLQVLILLMGNYGYFNYFCAALCLFALEDEAWPGFVKKWWARGAILSDVIPKVWVGWAPRGFLILVLFMTGIQFLQLFGFRHRLPSTVVAVYSVIQPFRTINGYGPFAVMTTTRNEIVVMGSRNGKDWKPYDFKYKPGDPGAAPVWIAPYMPRLDWQMWFAALGSVQANPWLVRFLGRLLETSPSVLGLLKNDPFPEGPPKFIKADLYEYRFTTPEEKAQTGRWWNLDYKNPYLPPFTMENLRNRLF